MATPLPMLSIQEKKPSPTPTTTCTTVADTELAALLRTRHKLFSPLPSSSSLESRVDLYRAYHHSLSKIEPHFTVSLERSHLRSLSFSWIDAFKSNKKHTHGSVRSEKAVVSFNIGAMYSQIGAREDRREKEGLKKACKAFQSAAGAFRFVREMFAPAAAAAGGGGGGGGGCETVDLSRECLGTLERLMLAQAEECFFEKAIGDGKSPEICSKVARQIGLYYDEAYAALNAAPLNHHFDKLWLNHTQLKSALFYAEACYRYSLSLREKEEIGEEIARLKIGINQLITTKKAAKGVAPPLSVAVSRLDRIMNSNLERANRENNRVYLMRIPAAGTLNDLPAVSLARAIPLENLLILDDNSSSSNNNNNNQR